MRVNFIVFIFAAFSAFAGQESLPTVSQFFFEVHLQVHRAIKLMQEGVEKDLEALWQEQNIIAGDLIREATYTIEMMGDFFYEDRFKGVLDESIKNMSAEFLEYVETVPSVKPHLEKLLWILQRQNKAQLYEEGAAKILGSAHKPAKAGAPGSLHDAEISEKTVCDYRTFLVVMGHLRECSVARRAALDELVDAILNEVYASMKDSWSVLPVKKATSLLKQFDEGRGFWDELPNYRYLSRLPGDVRGFERNFIRTQAYRLQRYLMLKILDSALAERVGHPGPGQGEELKVKVLAAAQIILSGLWPKVKEDFLNPLAVEGLSDAATQEGAVARALPAIKRILPDFAFALAKCPGVRDRIIAIMVRAHNDSEENKIIAEKFVKVESFLDGLLMLKNRSLRQQLDICDLEDHLRQMLQQNTKQPNARAALDIMRREDALCGAADTITVPGLVAQDVVTRLLREGLALCAKNFMLTLDPASSEEAMQVG